MNIREAVPKSPSSVFPTGWFQIAWSDDIAHGKVESLHHFGRDLVCYRGDSGRLVVLDARCPHLGAHLGFAFAGEVLDDAGRRRIEGDNIRCPWHGWCWGPDGTNVDIPYSERRHTGKGLRSWPVREIDGFVFLWHDALERSPMWDTPELPEARSDSGYYDYGWTRTVLRGRSVQPQMVVENAVDFEHLRYVHGHAGTITLEHIEIDGPVFRTRVRTDFNITEGKRPGNYPGQVQPSIHGVGIAIVRLSGIHDLVHYSSITPVDHQTSDVFAALMVKKISGEPEPNNFVQALVKQEYAEAERDMVMWENAMFTTKAPFPPEEKGFRDMRKWARQFYPDPALVEDLDPPDTGEGGVISVVDDPVIAQETRTP